MVGLVDATGIDSNVTKPVELGLFTAAIEFEDAQCSRLEESVNDIAKRKLFVVVAPSMRQYGVGRNVVCRKSLELFCCYVDKIHDDCNCVAICSGG